MRDRQLRCDVDYLLLRLKFWNIRINFTRKRNQNHHKTRN